MYRRQLILVIRRLWDIFALGLFLYVSCFLLMMDWRFPAYDPSVGTFTYECHFSYSIALPSAVPTRYGIALPQERVGRTQSSAPIDYLVRWARLVTRAQGPLTKTSLSAVYIVLFSCTLLVPLFFSLLVSADASGRRQWWQGLLSFFVAAWYYAPLHMYYLMHVGTVTVVLGKVIPVLVGVFLIIVVVRAGRGSWLLLTLPQGVAIVSGTVWLVCGGLGL